ncbi:hypothetical protein E2C01_096073 [Portunus trituberculatus]|uniref:Uncharacterized protein n=1 Tax=Portunus trituberculatus TaxID=210409 RepID=A0A5B7JUN7_PORTR|nr:hypothetical protein [Portunus trituberculatus]
MTNRVLTSVSPVTHVNILLIYHQDQKHYQKPVSLQLEPFENIGGAAEIFQHMDLSAGTPAWHERAAATFISTLHSSPLLGEACVYCLHLEAAPERTPRCSLVFPASPSSASPCLASLNLTRTLNGIVLD